MIYFSFTVESAGLDQVTENCSRIFKISKNTLEAFRNISTYKIGIFKPKKWFYSTKSVFHSLDLELVKKIAILWIPKWEDQELRMYR